MTSRCALAPGARTTRDEARALARWLEAAIDARIDLIQIRERDLEGGLLRDLVARAAILASATGTRIVVNDRADVARAAGAAGVHLRADAPAVGRVRPLGPAGWIVGRSIHTAAEALQHADADYLLFGTVFDTASKPDTPAAGLEALTEAARAARPPVLAIGGVTPERAASCAAAGAAGVAGIGIFLPPGRAAGSLGPARAADLLRAALARPVLE